MTKEQIFAVVKKHLMGTVDGLRESDITPDKSMKDMGANSLDICRGRFAFRCAS